MAVEFILGYTAGLGSSTLNVTLQRENGDYWTPGGGGAYQTAPAFADKRINMAEGASENAGTYTVSVSGLGSPGWLKVRYHNDTTSLGVVGYVYVSGDNEVVPTNLGTGSSLTALASQASVDDLPTVAEFEARTLVAANYATAANLALAMGATFDTATDSLEALRNRGDAAWITATGFSTHSAADVVTALGTGGSLTSLASASDQTAIKAKTDQLTFTVASTLDVNVQRINDVTITGNGTAGAPYNV